MRIAVLFLLSTMTFFSAAVEPVRHFARLTLDNGLSQNITYKITSDHHGFMWFATKDGLNRFDGHEFKVFRTSSDDPNSLSGNVIREIFVDNAGNLWVGTSQGLNRFDPLTHKFTHYLHNKSDSKSINDNDVRVINQDSKGNIWVGTKAGLNRLDVKTGQFKRFEQEQGNIRSMAKGTVRAIAFSHDGSMWVGTFGGGLSKMTDDEQFVHLRHSKSNVTSLANNKVISIAIDPQNRVWVGTTDGLSLFNEKQKTFTHFTKQRNALNHNTVLSLQMGQSNQLWVGTLNGANLIDTQTYEVKDVGLKPPQGKKAELVWSMYKGEHDTMWLATFNGVLRQTDPLRLFNHHHSDPTDKNSLSHGSVRAILKDHEGSLWIGTDGGGLNKHRLSTSGFEQIAGLPSPLIFALLQDKAGFLWIGTANGLVKRSLDGKTQQVFGKTDGLSDNIISSLFEDSAGRLWVGTYKGGLNLFEAGQFKSFKHDSNDSNSISHNVIRTINEDAKGQIWVGTLGGGLNRFDEDSNGFDRFTHDAQNSQSIGSNMINAIFVANDGLLWIGTGGAGLDKFDSQTNVFEHFTQQKGLSNDTVYGIAQDQADDLWLSTNRGLSRYQIKDNRFNHYDVNDGLQNNQFNPGAYFSANDGELFFGGVNGFNRFYPKQMSQKTPPGKPILTDFMLFNESVPVAKESESFNLPQSVHSLDELNLSHKENFISLKFSAQDHTNPEKVEYAYRLKGWDKDWITVAANMRQATYSNLPPGSYEFEFKAKVNHGHWKQNPDNLIINYHGPWYLTWWAMAFYALVLVSLIGLVISFRFERNKRKMELEVIAQLQYLDKLKDEFLANTSHELRTPLNGIIGLAESLLDGVAGKLPDKANKNLSMVITSGRRLASLVNDILDFSKLSNTVIELNTQPVDLFSTVELVLSLSKPLCENKDVELINTLAQNMSAVNADQDRLQQILHNLVGNAVKFTEQGEVKVSAEIIDEKVTITVSDTGIGIDESQYDNIFASFEQAQGSNDRLYGGTGLGLAVSKQLVELHGGSIWVESTIGKGSSFYFTLPVSQSKEFVQPFLDKQSVAKLNVLPAQLETIETLEQSIEHNEGDFRILLVDDEPVNRQVLHDHLLHRDYQLFEAANGQEALELIENSEPFDLVLLDIMMPQMTGYEVCAKLREQYPVNDLPVIFLTAKNQVVDLVESFDAGANDYLSKPVAKHELLSRVKTHLKLLDINRHLEQKVAERTDELVQATEAKSDFLAKMSHEIRTPMNAVIGLSRLALKTQLNEQQHDYLEKVVDAGEALLGLINDILDFSKIEAGKLTIESTSFEVDKMVQRSVNLSAMNAHVKGLELVTDIDKSIPRTLIGDPLRIQQIIVNLVNNAVKFTEVGAVCVKMHLGQNEQSQPTLHCSVIDTGIGMNEQQQSRMFQSFSQADESISRKHGGTGLGLSISRQLCELMDGKIWLTSEPDVGSEFHFTVQVKQDATDSQADLFDCSSFSELKMLVVDDEPMAARVLVGILADFGIDACAIEHVEKALDKVNETQYDLVFWDWTEQNQLIAKSINQDVMMMTSTYNKEKVAGNILEKPLNHGSVYKQLKRWQSGENTDLQQQNLGLAIPDLSGYRILLVDDNAINRQVACGFLTDTEATFDIAENGIVALAQLKQNQYDLVLMDIEMPQMDGMTATIEIRNSLNFSDLPIIAMTAHVLPAEIAKTRQAGMNAHLTKPIDPKALYQCLSSFLADKKGKTKKLLPSEPLPQISGHELKLMAKLSTVTAIDSQKAMANLHGRAALYLSMVKDFSQQQDLADDLQHLQQTQQFETLHRTIHSLKSNAAYIGAFKLQQLCAQLEDALADKQYDWQLLELVIETLTPILTALHGVFPQQVLKDAVYSKEKLQGSLALILPLLRASDLEVEDYLPGIQAMCQHTQYAEQVNQLVCLVDDIEYERAYKLALDLFDKVEQDE